MPRQPIDQRCERDADATDLHELNEELPCDLRRVTELRLGDGMLELVEEAFHPISHAQVHIDLDDPQGYDQRPEPVGG
jgi:hypothetical protein